MEIMGSISQAKVKVSKKRLELEEKRMENNHQLHMEKLEVEQKKMGV